MTDKMIIKCNPCTLCGKVNEVTVDPAAFKQWRDGAHIQNVMPELSAGEREMLISGTCSHCWDSLWKED